MSRTSSWDGYKSVTGPVCLCRSQSNLVASLEASLSQEFLRSCMMMMMMMMMMTNDDDDDDAKFTIIKELAACSLGPQPTRGAQYPYGRGEVLHMRKKDGGNTVCRPIVSEATRGAPGESWQRSRHFASRPCIRCFHLMRKPTNSSCSYHRLSFPKFQFVGLLLFIIELSSSLR
eukprot:4250484-Amphidinium_carterae.1